MPFPASCSQTHLASARPAGSGTPAQRPITHVLLFFVDGFFFYFFCFFFLFFFTLKKEVTAEFKFHRNFSPRLTGASPKYWWLPLKPPIQAGRKKRRKTKLKHLSRVRGPSTSPLPEPSQRAPRPSCGSTSEPTPRPRGKIHR